MNKYLLSVFLLAFSTVALADVENSNFNPLFNGQDFEDWTVVVKERGEVVDKQEFFGIKDGMIHAYPDQADGSEQPFAGLITKRSFSYYHLKLEYKWGTKKFPPRGEMVRDAGVMYHLFGDDIIWPDCLEIQIQEGDTGDAWIVGAQASSHVQNVIRNYSPNGNVVTRGSTEGPRFSRFHRGYMWERPGWNQIELIVEGDKATFIVNGHIVNALFDAKKPDGNGGWEPLTSGRILLQAEGAEVFYRNVVIKQLPRLPAK